MRRINIVSVDEEARAGAGLRALYVDGSALRRQPPPCWVVDVRDKATAHPIIWAMLMQIEASTPDWAARCGNDTSRLPVRRQTDRRRAHKALIVFLAGRLYRRTLRFFLPKFLIPEWHSNNGFPSLYWHLIFCHTFKWTYLRSKQNHNLFRRRRQRFCRIPFNLLRVVTLSDSQ